MGIAVGLAWLIGQLLGNKLPLFAAFGAVIAMQTTVDQSVRRVAIRLAGTIGGVLVSFLIVHLLGIGPLAVAFAVMLGPWIVHLAKAPKQIGQEIAMVALLLIALAAGNPEYAAHRTAETLLGAIVALVINALVFPPDYLDDVSEHLGAFVRDTTSVLRSAAHALVVQPEEPDRHREIIDQQMLAARKRLTQLTSDLALAKSARRFSPLLHKRKSAIERYDGAEELALAVVRQTHALARASQQHLDQLAATAHQCPPVGQHLERTTRDLADSLEALEEHTRTGQPEALQLARVRLERTEDGLNAFIHSLNRDWDYQTDPACLVGLSAAASALEQLTTSVRDAISQEEAASNGAADGVQGRLSTS
jgi:uncharacterized membrane protein YgaE (UPF0421/DUF939 family)